jgi:hypothetical protein
MRKDNVFTAKVQVDLQVNGQFVNELLPDNTI